MNSLNIENITMDAQQAYLKAKAYSTTKEEVLGNTLQFIIWNAERGSFYCTYVIKQEKEVIDYVVKELSKQNYTVHQKEQDPQVLKISWIQPV